ncbi:mannose-specific lectin-like [Notothenia coriiceps]|uniref:Mannose-specific lectin-like n=1 Tax=Notothenia coriiceps TaxID=8208 RepID=A0A6I9PG17_9TELE|nr:PREDICTED: mannose-specific lectin-like [Notothenia coriiceps]
MSRNFLSKNDELRKGDHLVSNNGEFKAVFQDDGNFVVYGWQPVWASDTAGSSPFRLCMQGDCNLVMYDKGDKAIWHTNTSKSDCNICRLQLTNEGKLVVNKEQDEVWNSDESTGMK